MRRSRGLSALGIVRAILFLCPMSASIVFRAPTLALFLQADLPTPTETANAVGRDTPALVLSLSSMPAAVITATPTSTSLPTLTDSLTLPATYTETPSSRAQTLGNFIYLPIVMQQASSPIITAVVVTASGVTFYGSEYYISPNSPISLSATVCGSGSFSHEVTWSIVSGGGSLSDTSGSIITFTAAPTTGLTVVRATANEDPSKYADVTIRTAVISVYAERAKATVLTGGSVPFLAIVELDSPSDADWDQDHLRWTIISGGGSVVGSYANGVSAIFTASDSTGTTILRAAAVADPSKYTDITITINSSGPHTCSNPPVILSGDATFHGGGNFGPNMPSVSGGSISNFDPLIGETQTLSLNVNVTSPATSPITAVTVTLITDSGRRPGQSLSLVSGTDLSGQWQGSWVIDDTHCNNYQIEIKATNATGTSTVTLTLD